MRSILDSLTDATFDGVDFLAILLLAAATFAWWFHYLNTRDDDVEHVHRHGEARRVLGIARNSQPGEMVELVECEKTAKAKPYDWSSEDA